MNLVRLQLEGLVIESATQEAILDYAAELVTQGLEKLGEHVYDVAVARVPVGKERHFNPKRGSLQRVQLRPPSHFDRDADKQYLLRFGALSARERADVVREGRGDPNLKHLLRFFQGTKKGKTHKISPSGLVVANGTIKGQFRHATGTLKRSIRFDGVRREGNTIIATVSANAPYAAAIHEGFTHRGGPNHDGRATFITGQPFLSSSLDNVIDLMTSPSTYEG